MIQRISTLVILGLAVACAGAPESTPEASPEVRREVASAPLALSGSAYDAAGQVDLPKVAAGEYEGLHNVFQLSDSIISGGEPEDEVALEQLSAWGVRTILSVDGKEPDRAEAERLGMRYVHVPIQYSGITSDEVTRISKAFRELEGPFYVHCFHGRHRGPAAAALGRIVIDGVEREQAIAEMRQWCATSSKYEGLYAAVATTPVPSAGATERLEFDFDAINSFDGIRAAMIPMPRHWDQVKAAADREWALDPEHPDLVPVREVLQVRQILDACAELPETQTYADDFREFLDQGRTGAADLIEALEAGAAGQLPDEVWRQRAALAVGQVQASCTDCHASYRDH